MRDISCPLTHKCAQVWDTDVVIQEISKCWIQEVSGTGLTTNEGYILSTNTQVWDKDVVILQRYQSV